MRLAVLFLAFVGGALALNWNKVRDNYFGLTVGTADVDLPFDALRGDTSEQQLGQRYAAATWRCVNEESHPLGSRQCYFYARSVQGVRAQFVVFFFRNGKLAHAKIDLPNWEHRNGERMLRAAYGAPTGAQRHPHLGFRLLGWQLSEGSVFYRRDRPTNPLDWTTIYWMSKKESDAVGGAFKQPQ